MEEWCELISQEEFERLKKEYNAINNSFKKSVIFHVGISAGFHSEVDGMMQCMLYCYSNKIRFILYADDANFSDGNGWEEFFEPFCDQNHSVLNKKSNVRSKLEFKNGMKKILFSWLLRCTENVNYLTQDIFYTVVDVQRLKNDRYDWDLFDIHGISLMEFGKLSKIALRYNTRTYNEIQSVIAQLNLPAEYCSVQFRNGDKDLECALLNDVGICLDRIDEHVGEELNLFIFSDDYTSVEETQNRKPNWNIYTLTQPEERGYYNDQFNMLAWEEKRKNMIKLFAMIEICLMSNIHFGNQQTSVNNYIRSVKEVMYKGRYVPIWAGADKPPEVN